MRRHLIRAAAGGMGHALVGLPPESCPKCGGVTGPWEVVHKKIKNGVSVGVRHNPCDYIEWRRTVP